MKSSLEKSGYQFNSDLGIWITHEYAGIAYSDGDEVEQRIARAVETVTDVSVFSSELKQHCTDWPSLYHLSSKRSNLMRPFQQLLQSADILEIGAGCGAITRYLGEAGANVLALEGSPRRAAIARSRTRDLANVDVVSETFGNFICDRKFDFITLIGVLEYASVFTQSDQPHLQMLERARQFLKPGGQLIIAIENQLGLKYFAGAPEDHIGRPMYGLENRYRPNQPKTFGRETLISLLKSAKFSTTTFLAPYPDYKLPVSIITEKGFLDEYFNASPLASQSAKFDPQTPNPSNFSLEFAYPDVLENKLGLDMANSFLVVATIKKKFRFEDPTVLGFHYSTDRASEFCKETQFVRADAGKIIVRCRGLGNPSSKNQQNLIKFVVNERSDYIQGHSYCDEFIQIVKNDGWTYGELATYVHNYIGILKNLGAFSNTDNFEITSKTKVYGKFFDVIPQNIIIRPDGYAEVIDQEWVINREIELGYLLFRSFLSLINSVPRFGLHAMMEATITRRNLIDGVLNEVGISLEGEDYDRYIDFESEIQQLVSGKPKNLFEDWGGDNPIPMREFEQGMKERDNQIVSLEQSMKERDNQIVKILSSNSWKITHPLRTVRRICITNPILKIREHNSKIARNIWNKLPLKIESKIRLKNQIFNRFPILFSWSRAYEEWKLFKQQEELCVNHYQKSEIKYIQENSELSAKASVQHSKFEPINNPAARIIAFYLPQFHPIPENNAWWGEGFTEWSNVKSAKPQFRGHYQPRLPGELNYYDLRDSSVQRRQIELAKNYGISGFCFYFYWFKGKRLLETPILNFLNNRNLDLPFCLCWANENWSRRWDGLDSEMLITQEHSPEDDVNFIEYVSRYLKDPRYIKIDGKPLILVYRPSLLPDAKNTANRWRAWCRKHGVGEIYLAYTQSFESVDPKKYGFDAAIEFPPNNSAPPNVTELTKGLNKDFAGAIYDWNIFLERSKNYNRPNYKLFRSVNPGWDNTARRRNKGKIFVNNSPAKYQTWLARAIKDTVVNFVQKDERLVFVNAWNEWAEGAYLEPDQRLGYAYLTATRNAVEVASATKMTKGSSSDILAVVVHCFYLDVFSELVGKLTGIPIEMKIYVTTTIENQKHVQDLLDRCGLNYRIMVVENRGRDIFPFLQILPLVIQFGHEVILKLHTKKSKHRGDGDVWRDDLYSKLLNPVFIKKFVHEFKINHDLGMIAPSGHIVSMETYWGSNQERVLSISERLGVPINKVLSQPFAAGSMFYARVETLRPLLSLGFKGNDFEEEAGQVDDTLAHAIERVFAICLLSEDKQLLSTDLVDSNGAALIEEYKFTSKN